MTVKEALVYFAGHPRLVDKLYVLDEVGLGYVRLGQSATTLSGGEAQRVKLASHLAMARSVINRSTNNETAAKARSRTLYILDEPTTGLHFDDVAKLLAAFHKLIEGGGSLLVIEHNLDVIKSADWVIDMGPEGGNAGGQVVAIGTPEEIAANPPQPHRPLACPCTAPWSPCMNLSALALCLIVASAASAQDFSGAEKDSSARLRSPRCG